MNIATIIDDIDAERIALIDGEYTISYGELRTRVAQCRGMLVSQGVGPGDRVAIAAGNEPAFAVALLGTLGVGAVAVPVNPTNPLPEFERKIRAVEPSLAIIGEAANWMLGKELSVPIVDLAVSTDATDLPAVVDREPDDLAALMLTSGVSGPAKAAMLTHHNLGWMQETLLTSVPDGVLADDVVLGVLPFSHIFGLNVVLLTSLRVGATIVLQHRFDPDESLRLIERHLVTSIAGAPPMWQRWAGAQGAAGALSSVRRATSGAAALPVAVFEAVRDRYGLEISEGYGLTETSPVVTTSNGMDPKPTSVGKPLKGVEVRLLEEDGTDVESGDTGEVWVRSPGVFAGYWKDQEATDEVLSASGWFRTGDVGVFDDDGYLYLVDRIKDLIIVSGFNVYPAEVEDVLMEHPDVRGAVVVGTPDGRTGEAVAAFVTGKVDSEQLKSFAAERLSRYKCPTHIQIVDELPVHPGTGKRVRRELR